MSVSFLAIVYLRSLFREYVTNMLGFGFGDISIADGREGRKMSS